MIRNPELIRGILLDVEQQAAPVGAEQLKYDEFDPAPTLEEIAGHMALLGDAGYAEIATQKDHTGMISSAVIFRLTHKGHEFLDSIRDNDIWTQVKGHFKSAMTSVTLEVIKVAAVGYVKKKYGIS